MMEWEPVYRVATLGFIVGIVFANRLARPVGSLAGAAERIAGGDFQAGVERSAIAEVDQVAEAFEVRFVPMPGALALLGIAGIGRRRRRRRRPQDAAVRA